MSKPLTIDELKSLEVGDWVWVINLYCNEAYYAQKVYDEEFDCHFNTTDDEYYLSDNEQRWLAYKNKEQAESKGEIVELPCEVGDTVYWNNGVCVTPHRVDGFADYNDGMGMRLLIGEMQPSLLLVGKDLFFDKSKTERRLAELRGEK